MVELGLHLHRRKPVHLLELLQHVFLPAPVCQTLPINVGLRCALYDRWNRVSPGMAHDGLCLHLPLRAHPSVQAVLPDSREQHPRPTAHDRSWAVSVYLAHLLQKHARSPPAHSAEGSRRDRTSPLSLRRRERRRLVSPVSPAALSRGPRIHRRVISAARDPHEHDLAHPRAFFVARVRSTQQGW